MSVLREYLALLFWAFCLFTLNAQKALPPLTKSDMAKAKSNYQQYCSLCHGNNREGNAADYAPSLKSKSLMSTIPLNFLASSIAFGRPQTAMAAYLEDLGGPLSMKDIFSLALWLKHQSGHKTIDIPEGEISGNIDLGSKTYQQHCAECHGKKGEGITAPSLANPAFLAFASDHYIKYAIEKGRDSSKMTPFAQVLSNAEINDLTAYIRSLASG